MSIAVAILLVGKVNTGRGFVTAVLFLLFSVAWSAIPML